MQHTTIGLDLAKNVFYVHGMSFDGETVIPQGVEPRDEGMLTD